MTMRFIPKIIYLLKVEAEISGYCSRSQNAAFLIKY